MMNSYIDSASNTCQSNENIVILTDIDMLHYIVFILKDKYLIKCHYHQKLGTCRKEKKSINASRLDLLALPRVINKWANLVTICILI